MTVPPLGQVGLAFPVEQSGRIIVCDFTNFSNAVANTKNKMLIIDDDVAR